MIDIQSNIKEATKYLSDVQRKVIPKATVTSLNKTARTVFKEVKRDVSKDIGLKQKEVAERMYLRKAHKNSQYASIGVRSRYFNLIRFKAKQFKRGVKAKAWGKTKTYRGTFIGNDGRTVFTRRTKRRLPLKGVVGPNPAVEFERRMKNPQFNRRVVNRFEKVFAHELAFRLSRLN